MFEDLEKNGCIPKKAFKLQFPKLNKRELELAFLMGYFDGDGTQGTTKITSSSRIFLKQIKKKFEVENKIISKDKREKAFDLHLGVELFNEMLGNYKKSLPRKRIKMSTIKKHKT